MHIEKDLRMTRVLIYMTEEDAETLNRMARDLKFKSRSTFIVAILERLIIGGFSVASFFKVGSQIMKRIDEHASPQFEFNFAALKLAMRPLPALPVADDPTPKETRKGIAEIKEDLTKTQIAC